MKPSSRTPAVLIQQGCDPAYYLALKARDARFDGRFFTGVVSTGIYCRPVCKVRTPKWENCRFFTLAAQAEAAGFRPCLRCRPELAPGAGHDFGQPWSTQDASAMLAHQAAIYLQNLVRHGSEGGGPSATGMAELARHLGISDRHLRRIFATHWGISPLQYLQTHRLLTAKQLLTDTQLPVAHIAQRSGFGSLRRFNAAFLEHYRLQPQALRKLPTSEGGGAQNISQTVQRPRGIPGPVTGPVAGLVASTASARQARGVVTLKLGYRPPYHLAAMLGFLQQRAIDGMEVVDLAARTWTRTLTIRQGPQSLRGWMQARFLPHEHCVALTLGESLTPALPILLAAIRAALDLDADPQAIDACLLADFPGTEGMRVPGTVDGFELAVRAILGQQITVAAARTLGQRLVHALGDAVEAPTLLQRYFPTAECLAATSPATLGALGIVRQRQTALIALARAVAHEGLSLQPTTLPEAGIARLLALPGIGPWTAQYIAMRALRWPDAFPAGDVALQNALHVRHERFAARAAEAASAAWRPWRSYAVLRAWQSLAKPAPATQPRSAPAVFVTLPQARLAE